MKPITISPWIMGLFMILLGLYIGYTLNNKPLVSFNNYNTDTLNSTIPHQEVRRDTFSLAVRPHIVINYPPADTRHISIIMDDSLLRVIDSLNKKITVINPDYLKQYPSAPKIVYGKFTKDSLQVDLLEISGKIHSLRYPVNFDGYNYQLVNSELKAEKLKRKIFKEHPGQLVLFGGYGILHKAPLTSIQYQKGLGRFILQGEMGSIIQKTPEIFINGKVGYQLNRINGKR